MNRSIELAVGDRLELKDCGQARLWLARGRVWLTQEGDPEDHVLASGDVLALDPGSLALAEAQEHSIVVIEGAAALTVRPFGQAVLGLRRAWRRWLYAIERRPLPQLY